MTTPCLARTTPEFEGGYRYYPWPLPPREEQIRLPSVTTVAGLAPSGGMENWAARLAAEAVAAGMDINDAKRAHERVRDAAADIGTRAHTAIECWATGLPQVEDGFEGYVRAAAAAMAAMQIEPLPKHVEATVYNPEHGYAGTADMFGRYPDGQMVVVDWKTGSVQFPTRGLQMAALAKAPLQAVKSANTGDWTTVGIEPVARAIAVSVQADGSWDWRCWVGSEIDYEYETFLALRKIWDWYLVKWTLRGV